MTGSVVELHKGTPVTIDQAAVLRSLNLNPQDPKTQALLLVCDRYKLDPLLKHMVLISGNPYVTRDGYLAIAHASGVFDGIEVVEQGETDTHHTAKVSVYRKDMSRPFTFTGRYPKAGRMSRDYGPEMAVKCAEVASLRRAFNVTGVGAADERWDAEADAHLVEATEVEMATPEQLEDLRQVLAEVAEDADRKAELAGWWKDEALPPLDSGMLTAEEAARIIGRAAGLLDAASEPTTAGTDTSTDADHLDVEPVAEVVEGDVVYGDESPFTDDDSDGVA